MVFLHLPIHLPQLVQSDLDEDDDERLSLGGRGTLRFKHKHPVELRGPDGVHVVHGSTGTLLTSDLNSLPEDDQRALARSLEALHADGALYAERNARTESAKSTPLHRNKGGNSRSESPLEITELWLAEASLVWEEKSKKGSWPPPHCSFLKEDCTWVSVGHKWDDDDECVQTRSPASGNKCLEITIYLFIVCLFAI